MAVSTIFGGFIYMMLLGSYYATGTIAPYIHSYFDMSNESRLETDLIPLTLAMNIISMPIGSFFI